MKWIYIILLSLLIPSCSMYYQANTYTGFSSMYIESWKKGNIPATYSVFGECKEFDDGNNGMFDCLYDRGYKFKPSVGFCLYSSNLYICDNAEKYKN